jgi:hypothetical protein
VRNAIQAAKDEDTSESEEEDSDSDQESDEEPDFEIDIPDESFMSNFRNRTAEHDSLNEDPADIDYDGAEGMWQDEYDPEDELRSESLVLSRLIFSLTCAESQRLISLVSSFFVIFPRTRRFS